MAGLRFSAGQAEKVVIKTRYGAASANPASPPHENYGVYGILTHFTQKTPLKLFPNGLQITGQVLK